MKTNSLMKILGQVPHACISHKELLQNSMDYARKEHAKEVIKSLDEARVELHCALDLCMN